MAHELGVSVPALYRYFAGRGALLREVVADAYDDSSAVLALASAAGDLGERLHGFATAYRRWALADPHRYRMPLAVPFDGRDPRTDPLLAEGDLFAGVLLDALAGAATHVQSSAELAGQLRRWMHRRRSPDVPPVTALAAMRFQTLLIGLLAQGIEGCFSAADHDGRLLLGQEVSRFVASVGSGSP